MEIAEISRGITTKATDSEVAIEITTRDRKARVAAASRAMIVEATLAVGVVMVTVELEAEDLLEIVAEDLEIVGHPLPAATVVVALLQHGVVHLHQHPGTIAVEEVTAAAMPAEAMHHLRRALMVAIIGILDMVAHRNLLQEAMLRNLLMAVLLTVPRNAVLHLRRSHRPRVREQTEGLLRVADRTPAAVAIIGGESQLHESTWPSCL